MVITTSGSRERGEHHPEIMVMRDKTEIERTGDITEELVMEDMAGVAIMGDMAETTTEIDIIIDRIIEEVTEEETVIEGDMLEIIVIDSTTDKDQDMVDQHHLHLSLDPSHHPHLASHPTHHHLLEVSHQRMVSCLIMMEIM